MSVPILFVPHSVRIDTPAGQSWMNQIVDGGIDNGISLFEESGSGATEREYTAINERNPMVRFTSTDLTLLAAVGFNGLRIYPGASNGGIYLWGKAKALGGLNEAEASTVHLKATVTDGLLIPETMSANHKGVARVTYALYPIKGAIAQSQARPLIFAKDQAIITGGGATSLIFTCGAVKYTSGTSKLVTGITEMSLNFGLNVVREGGDGDVDPTFACIMARDPAFSFSTKDGELLADIGEDGKSCTSFAMYFQKVDQSGTRVAASTGQHISVIATAGILVPGGINLSHLSTADAAFAFTPSKPVGEIITIATNAQIPTS